MSKKKVDHRSGVSTPWLAALAAAAVGIVISLGAATASNAASHSLALPPAHGSMQRVVVMLRNTHTSARPLSAGHLNAIRNQVTPFVQSLRSAGATHITAGTVIPYFSATVSAAQRAALAKNPAVKAVFLNQKIQLAPPLSTKQLDAMQAPAVRKGALLRTAARAGAGKYSLCGTASKPEKDPEALSVINAQNPSYDGAGVHVAYIADHITNTIADFQRNPKYVGPGSPAGPVVHEVNFNGDPAGYDYGGLEAFLDMSSIAAQGNTVHDLSQYVNPSHPLPAGCDVTVTGVAPGSTVTGLNVFSQKFNTTTSYFVQAIDWAAAHHVDVLNESFGSNPFPDNANDAVRMADDAAVAAGVTVVVSSGDAGSTSTDGSPATDPNLISVGASTTFRSYQQTKYGGIDATTPAATNGSWLDNNISGISSGGYSQSGGNTVSLVAPGDLNWIACDASITFGCGATNLTVEGGTSESSPLTAGAAADVIQAYRATHNGQSPTPAQVKTILVSTARDISAPAEQQGAGLLDVGAAIELATTIDNGTKPSTKHALSFTTNQINIQGDAGSSSKHVFGITNNGKESRYVRLSTRELSNEVSTSTGSACLNPTSGNIPCGPPTQNTFLRENGSTQVYVEQQFTVPKTSTPSRLNFSAALPAQSTNYSILKVALYAPNGAYAGYSIPQGISNYANIQVSNPKPGTWTAVLFDTRNDQAERGVVSWEADTWTFGAGGKIDPSRMFVIKPGQTRWVHYTAKLPRTPGDTSQSIVVRSDAATNTIPVTIRTLAKPGKTFDGVLTGGNGRGNPAVQSTYAFNVPAGENDIDVSVAFADINDGVVAFLQNPEGNNVAQTSNLYAGGTFTNTVTVYKDHPEAGKWTLVLDWLQPVSGAAINTPFTGRVDFNKVTVNSNLPSTGTLLPQNSASNFTVSYKNTSSEPQLIFLDPRQSSSSWIGLADLLGNQANMPLPTQGFSNPIYLVPQDSSELFAGLASSSPVSFDFDPWTGDPDLYAQGMNPVYDYVPNGGEVTSGFWGMFPSEVGPFSSAGANTNVTATPFLYAYTQAFDSTVNTETGDLWSYFNGYSNNWSPAEVNPGETVQIPVQITPSASPGTTVNGMINVDDVYLESPFLTTGIGDGGDQLASIPYTYTVAPAGP